MQAAVNRLKNASVNVVSQLKNAVIDIDYQHGPVENAAFKVHWLKNADVEVDGLKSVAPQCLNTIKCSLSE